TGGRAAGPSMSPQSLNEHFPGDLAACEVANQILDEWSRVDLHQPSCLDSTNYACDWSPKDFARRWVNNFTNYASKDRNDDYEDCKMVETAVKFPRTDHVATHKDVETLAAKLKKILQNTPILNKDTFGQDKTETEMFGNNTIGAGYDYHSLWEANIYDRTT